MTKEETKREYQRKYARENRRKLRDYHRQYMQHVRAEKITNFRLPSEKWHPTENFIFAEGEVTI